MHKATAHGPSTTRSLPASDPLPVSTANPRQDATAGSDRRGPDPSPVLATLLKKAAAAAPDRRIELRDRIAAHGARAIDAVRPWLEDGRLAAFAIRVIERAGCDGEPELASQVLRSARAHLPPGMTGDADWALQHLRAIMRPEPATERPASPRVPPVARRSGATIPPRTRRPAFPDRSNT